MLHTVAPIARCEPHRLALDDLFDLQYIRDARLSPDGRRVAYAVSYTDKTDERFEIRIVELDSGVIQRLPHSGNATAPRWSPDGSWLAFVGDGQLRIAAVPSLDIAEPLTPTTLSAQGAPCWSPDGTRLVTCLLGRQIVEGSRRVTNKVFRAEGLGFIDDMTQRIHVVDRSSRLLRCLTGSAEGICSQPEWSPCGRRVLFFSTSDAVPGSSYSPRLMTVGIDDGAIDTVLSEPWFITAARWLPDGERIAVAAAPNSTLSIPSPSLWVVDLGGKAEIRTPRMTGKIGGVIHHDMPAWDLTRSNPITILDQTAAFVTILSAGSIEIWRVALVGEIEVQRVLTGERSCIALDASPQFKTLLYAVTDLYSPTELWRAELDGWKQERLTELNDQVLARWPTMHVEHFISTSADDIKIDTWFMAPANSRFPLPTVLFVHGGPFAATGHAFRFDFHLLASHGFGVLFANFRGSAGYGEDFTRAIMGNWGARGFPDHIGAVDTAIARGFADPERLGVWGASHGGFATCWIVGHTSRFKAAIAEAAITNFTTLYYLTDGPEVFARDLGGRPHEIPDVYRACSPITYAHRCTTPTLFVHGEDDLRCPISEAEQFYRVLHDVGCTTELVRIPGCNHLGDSCGPLTARRAQNAVLLSWFQRHL